MLDNRPARSFGGLGDGPANALKERRGLGVAFLRLLPVLSEMLVAQHLLAAAFPGSRALGFPLLAQLAKIADGRRGQVIWRTSVERRSTEVSVSDATALGTLPCSRLGTYDVATLCSASVLPALARRLGVLFGRALDR